MVVGLFISTLSKKEQDIIFRFLKYIFISIPANLYMLHLQYESSKKMLEYRNRLRRKADDKKNNER